MSDPYREKALAILAALKTLPRPPRAEIITAALRQVAQETERAKVEQIRNSSLQFMSCGCLSQVEHLPSVVPPKE